LLTVNRLTGPEDKTGLEIADPVNH